MQKSPILSQKAATIFKTKTPTTDLLTGRGRVRCVLGAVF